MKEKRPTWNPSVTYMKPRLMRFVRLFRYSEGREGGSGESRSRVGEKSIEGLHAQRKCTSLETLSTSREKASRVWLLPSFPLLSHSHETFTRSTIIIPLLVLDSIRNFYKSYTILLQFMIVGTRLFFFIFALIILRELFLLLLSLRFFTTCSGCN